MYRSVHIRHSVLIGIECQVLKRYWIIIFMKLGRKCSFDREDALDKAMKLFWAGGYSGTSISDLTAELGINKPSLYAAFGNKEQLFKSALSFYQEKYTAPRYATLLEPRTDSLSTRLEAFLRSIAEVVTDPKLPMGCLYVNSTCESGAKDMTSEILEDLYNIKGDTMQYFVDVFKKEQVLGNLSKEADVVIISNYLMAILFGMGVLAKNGSTLNELEPVIKITVDSLLR